MSGSCFIDFGALEHDVRYWPLASLSALQPNGRFRMRSGHATDIIDWSKLTELVRKGFIYVALMNAMSSLTTMPGPIGTSRGFAISSFLNSILPFHTLRKKSSKA